MQEEMWKAVVQEHIVIPTHYEVISMEKVRGAHTHTHTNVPHDIVNIASDFHYNNYISVLFYRSPNHNTI